MVLTQKETMLLQELKSQEQLCVEKYAKYAETACDEPLRQLFTQIGSTEQQHLDTVSQMLNGNLPAQSGGQGQGQSQSQSQGNVSQSSGASTCSPNAKKQDQYLCQDALGTEKHVSSVYNTSLFEFKSAAARDTLNHIQKEEQNHGKAIYDYMSSNGMYS